MKNKGTNMYEKQKIGLDIEYLFYVFKKSCDCFNEKVMGGVRKSLRSQPWPFSDHLWLNQRASRRISSCRACLPTWARVARHFVGVMTSRLTWSRQHTAAAMADAAEEAFQSGW